MKQTEVKKAKLDVGEGESVLHIVADEKEYMRKDGVPHKTLCGLVLNQRLVPATWPMCVVCEDLVK